VGVPEEGLAQCFSYSVTLMLVSKSKQKGRPVALAALVPLACTKEGCGYTPAYLEISGRNTPGCKNRTDDKFGVGKTCVYRQVFSFMLLGNRQQVYKSGFFWLCFVSF